MITFKNIARWLYIVVIKKGIVRRKKMNRKMPIHGSHIDTYNCFQLANLKRKSLSMDQEEIETEVE